MVRVIRELRCLRCGHRWFPRGPKQPGHCPNPCCNSPYWNRPRRRKQSTPKTKTFTKSVRSRSAAQPNSVEKIESPEMVWLEANARELEQHAGEWLLIQGRKLLVHSRDFADLRAVIHERELRSPFVYYVPTDEESNAVTI